MSRKLLARASTQLRIGLATAVFMTAVACSGKAGGPANTGSNAPIAKESTSFTLFALAEVRGQIEPCGCTTDPLGDLSRTAKLIAEARKLGPVVVVDAGSLLFSKSPVPDQIAPQEELKADLLAHAYKDTLMVSAVGLGPADLARGPGETRLPREIANLSATPGITIEQPKIIDAGGIKVGVFGVTAADAAPGLKVNDPVVAGKQARDDLKSRGAQLVIGMVQASSKKDALQIVRGIGGLDIGVLGLGLSAPEPDKIRALAENVDGTVIVIPASKGQVISRMSITVRPGKAPLVDAIGASAAHDEIADIDAQMKTADADLAKFAADPTSDPKFVATKKQERAAMAAKRASLTSNPLQAPATGSYFTLDQIRITKELSCDLTIQDAKSAYDRAAGEANVKAAATEPALPVPAKSATYVGVEECANCHAKAVDFWKHTRHAEAWQTLVDVGKQFDYECIACHVTGWEKPGGATMAKNETLRDIQCETCHGPGSIHADKEGKEKPLSVSKGPESTLCANQCHTKEHSDTFQFESYLRDIVGPGHGEARRKELGDGPTGHELRAAGLEKSGHTIGAGCRK